MSDSDVVIRVEGLGKKYALHHEKGERYTALRDVVARQAKAAGRLLNPFTLGGQLRKAQREAAAERAESDEEFWALKDVSFEIRRGERVGIIGRNGAGKSTLLKILSRITEPSTGRVEIRGRVASLLEVGTGFHPELTGRENIYLNGAILGMTRREIRAKFDEIVDFAEVEKFLDTPVKHYSSGMYVRLAFAVAAHLEPEILVVDEVLAVGDASFQKKCLGKMETATEGEGRTLLFVSHQLDALRRLCPKSIYLKQGTAANLEETGCAIDQYRSNTQESSTISHQDQLASRKDRSGSGEIIFTSAILTKKSGLAGNSVTSGESVTFMLTCKALQEVQGIDQLVFAIDLLDQDQRYVVRFISDEMGIKLRGSQKCEKGDLLSVKLHVPHLLLREAIYSARLTVAKSSMGYMHKLDGINDAFSLLVQRGDYWATGKHGRPGGTALLEGEFSLWIDPRCAKFPDNHTDLQA